MLEQVPSSVRHLVANEFQAATGIDAAATASSLVRQVGKYSTPWYAISRGYWIVVVLWYTGPLSPRCFSLESRVCTTALRTLVLKSEHEIHGSVLMIRSTDLIDHPRVDYTGTATFASCHSLNKKSLSRAHGWFISLLVKLYLPLYEQSPNACTA